MALSTCIPVRLTGPANKALASLHKKTKVNKSALIRLAVAAGLPIITAQFAPEAPPPTTKKRRTAA